MLGLYWKGANEKREVTMVGKSSAALLMGLLAACATGTLARPAAGETLVQQSAEARMQLDFHVPDPAL